MLNRCLGIAALMAVVAACGGDAVRDQEAPSGTASPPTTAVTTVSTETSTSTTLARIPTTAGPPTTTAPPTTTTSVPEVREFETSQPVQLTMTIPSEWRRDEASTHETLVVLTQSGPGNELLVSRERDMTVEEWREWLTSHEGLVVSEPAPVEIGSGEGFVVDVRLGENASERGCPGSGSCVPILQGIGWVVTDGYPNRLWIVDRDGEAMAILTEASENGFDNWTARVEEVLATLDWNPDS